MWQVVQRTLNGAKQGGLAGAVLSVATGAAVVVTTPAWLPFVGGCVAFHAATAAAWAGIGALAGGAVGGTCEVVRQQKLDRMIRG